MDLILWRHAEAHPARDGQDDLSRALTPKGERQAQRMADWLNRRITESTRVYASPAVRTQQTAKALGRRIKTAAELAPDASGDALLQLVGWPRGSAPVLVVGHQPTLGLVAALLLGERPQPWTVKKGAVWWLRYRDREGGAGVLLQAVMSPDAV